MTLIAPHGSGNFRFSRALARCYWILKPDSTEATVTSWDQDLELPVHFSKNGATLVFKTGRMISVREERRQLGMNESTHAMTIKFGAGEAFDEDDVAKGNIVGSEVLLAVYDPLRPHVGYLYSFLYTIPSYRVDGQQLDLDMVGLSGGVLIEQIGALWTLSCRNKFAEEPFCDRGGAITSNPRYVPTPAIVDRVDNRGQFDLITLKASFPADLAAFIEDEDDEVFWGGSLTFTSGPLSGEVFGVESYEPAEFTLTEIKFLRLKLIGIPSDKVGIGDTVDILGGCNRNATTCVLRWANRTNFRGGNLMGGTEKQLINPTAQ